MIGVIQFTINKLKEPSFIILLISFMLTGVNFSTSSSLSENMSSDIVNDVITAGKGYPLLSGTIFAVIISLLMTIFIGGSEIPREISTRTIMLILSKPIRKETYLIGKFLGVFIMGLLFFLSFEIPMLASIITKGNSTGSFPFIIRQLSVALTILPVAAITVTISCFTAEISSMILTVCYLLFGLSIAMTPILLAALPEGMGNITFLMNSIYYMFPNFIYFLKDMNVFSFNFVALTIYATSITAIFLNAAAIRMNTRDIDIE